MTHHFSINPRSILGVTVNASLEEIQQAFREKSKKHHPDLGGDEWAFRLVVRAYEVLKATRDIEPQPVSATATAAGTTGFHAGSWSSEAHEPSSGPSGFSNGRPSGSSPPFGDGSATGPQPTTGYGGPFQASSSIPTAAEFHTLDAELVWIRFELADRAPELHEEPAATTLSVCLVITWPRTALVRHAPGFPDAAEKLRLVIETFGELRGQERALSSRSRIEDGQFVGWLSYPNVLQAETAFQHLQKSLEAHAMRVTLHTRDEPLPMEWMDR